MSSTDAAFAGFTLVRERPALFVGLTVLVLLLGLAASVLQVEVAGPAVTRLMALQVDSASTGVPADPAVVMPLMGPIWEMNLVLLPVILLFYAVTNAAVYRALSRPAQGRFGYLRLGADELRLLGSTLLFGLAMIGVMILAEIGAIVLGVLAGVLLAGLAHGNAGASRPLAVAVGSVVAVCIFAPVVLVAVRLSLAGPMTFAQGRVRLTGSWPMTRGRFWAMLGAYLLAGAVLAVTAVLVLVLCCVIALLLGGVAGVRGLFVPDSSSLAAFFTPARLLLMLVNAPFGALWIVVTAAVSADLHRQIVAGAVDPDLFGPDRSHIFGTPPAPVPPPPHAEYPITPPRSPPPDAP